MRKERTRLWEEEGRDEVEFEEKGRSKGWESKSSAACTTLVESSLVRVLTRPSYQERVDLHYLN